ncbi:alpha-amylase family glycosyl hydrolase [Mycoplasmopsis alligatoris]|uniref:Alpha-amylase n=1 Tax=Mycoplasmopsis alligatoris A21JP2 TaxID=747682 RepID=D4XWN5_9BACT|nr:alpha-amylase family glycosyl hydrolase [Mycoplasmopsis alligatoris]EFF41288.1 alpha amylase, catalytic domain protein [Mycoplasmopsis alligatoris A21JP2]
MKKNTSKKLLKFSLGFLGAIISPIIFLMSCSSVKKDVNNDSKKTEEETIKNKEKVNKEFNSWGSEKYWADSKVLSYEKLANEAKFIAPFNKEIQPSNVNYQLLVYAFADGNGDGIGDFIGLKNNIDYFTNLGIDQLYLSPIHPSSSYHGYDIIDYTDVAKELGGMEAFKEFLKVAHQKGIRVYLDMVFNHTSFEHPWFQEALKGNKDYEGFYRFMPSDHGLKSAYGVDDGNIRKYTQNDDPNIQPTNRHYVAAFSTWMPDLNLDNPKLREELKNVQKFWAKLGVDGFRYDAFYHYWDGGMFGQNHFEPMDNDGTKTAKILAELREATESVMTEKERFSNKINMFGEWWKSPQESLKYLKSNDKIALNSVIDGAHWKDGSSLAISPDQEKGILNFIKESNNNQKWMPFLDNHDVNRWINNYRSTLNIPFKTEQKLNDIFKSTLQAALFQLVLRPGDPTIFHGDELDLHASKKTDPNLREPFNWEDASKVIAFDEAKSKNDLIKLNDSKVETTVEQALKNPLSTYNIVKKAIEIKKQFPWISEQNPEFVKNPLDYLEGEDATRSTIIARENKEGQVLVIVYTYGLSATSFSLKNNLKNVKIVYNSGYKIENNSFESDKGEIVVISATK